MINNPTPVGVICPKCSGVKSIIVQELKEVPVESGTFKINKTKEKTCDLCKGKGWLPFMDHISDALRWLAEECHRTAKDHGWWEHQQDAVTHNYVPHNVPEKLALMHSELSEALEEYRKGTPLSSLYYLNELTKITGIEYEQNAKPEGFTVELADLFIRVFDFLAGFELTEQFIQAMLLKMEYNKSRPYRHGGK